MKHQKTVEQTVINFIKKYELLKGSRKILIGLSGGSDSVFALHFFVKFRRKYNIEIAAVHVNHSLRGEESKNDAQFCRRLCQKYNIEFFCKKVNVRLFADRSGRSIEEAARELRYKEFEKVFKICKADRIVTAHNIDDNTETVILNLSRGSGIKGLSGIPWKRDNIIRPFLVLSKEDIIKYLQKRKLDFVVDSSNKNTEFIRNYLRQLIIPQLRSKFNDSIDKKIFQSSEILRYQFILLDYFISEVVDKITLIEKNFVVINLQKLREYPEQIFGEVLRKIFENNFNEIFSYDIFCRVNNLVKAQVGSITNISKDIKVVRERGKILIYNLSEDKVSEESEKKINIGEKIKLGNKNLSISKVEKLPDNYKRSASIEYVSGDFIKGALKIRKWKFGDKIKLLGMDGTKKVSDVLTDLKIPSVERVDQYVLEYRNEIIWLVGHRISDKYKITENTKRIIKLCLN